jgi:hypothetical protein
LFSGVGEPDESFIDESCDGIDGDLARVIFVSPGGNDAGPGTMEQPVQTLTQALSLAVPVVRDLVDQGTYTESITQVDGVGIHGKWQSSRAGRGQRCTPPRFWAERPRSPRPV